MGPLLRTWLGMYRCSTSETFYARPMANFSTISLRRLAIASGVVAIASGTLLVAEVWFDILSAGLDAVLITVFMVSMAAGVGFGLAALERNERPNRGGR